MEAATNGKEFFDYKTPPNLFGLVECDDMDQFKLKVTKKEVINHDTYLIELEFPNAEWISGLWPGAHYFWHLEVNGKMLARKYTPISAVNQKGKSVFAVKIYRENPEFPNGGLFT